LKEQHFLRIHKSHLINPTHIESYDKQGWLKMSDGSEVEVARRKKEYVQDALKNL
jgi:two-component system, LytTR family, response regulator